MPMDNSIMENNMNLGAKYLHPQKLMMLEDMLWTYNNNGEISQVMTLIGEFEDMKMGTRETDLDSLKYQFENFYGDKSTIEKAIVTLSKHGPELYEAVGGTSINSDQLDEMKKENAVLEQINEERYAQNPERRNAKLVFAGDLEQAVQVLNSNYEKGESVVIDYQGPEGHLFYSADGPTTVEKLNEQMKEKFDRIIINEKKQTHGIDEVKEALSEQRIGTVNETTREVNQAVRESQREEKQGEQEEQL